MVVEDEPMLQEVYRLVLEKGGYKVISAYNGAEALEKLNAETPNVILLDILMPIMDGKKFMHTIDLTKFPSTKIIVHSNLLDSKVEAEMLELGALKVILKSSMTPLELVTMIDAA